MHNKLKVQEISFSLRLLSLPYLVLVLLSNCSWSNLRSTSIRKIPIQYAKRVAGRTPQVGGQQTHLPLKVNAAGVIPVIFAIAFIVTPQTIATFFGQNNFTTFITNTFDYTKPVGMIIYIALIVAFTYFYAFIQVNPENVADNLKKQGAYIPGIRPGNDTQTYLTRVLISFNFCWCDFLSCYFSLANSVY